jgi:membrane protease subunit HflK
MSVNMRSNLPKKIMLLIVLCVVIGIVAVYFMTGFYQVAPSEVGLVKRFGKHIRTDQPGINYHFPAPFESVTIVDILSVRKIEIGFRTVSANRYTSVVSEALMMTGDNNFASVECVVQYRIKDPALFAFNVLNPEEIVKALSESVIRERVALRTVDEVLTSDRDAIAIEAKERLQYLLDRFGIGVSLENVRLQEASPPSEVISAFDDVNSALQDKEKTINTALRFYNDLVPKAQGEAAKVIQEAEAYRDVRILAAQGEVARFSQVLEKYEVSPEITRQRLYIETIEKILPNFRTLILPENTGNTLNILDIQSLLAGGAE